MLSRTGQYALQILGHLVRHPGERLSAQEIAAETGIPGNYLGKILNQLRKHGFVTSQRGWGGGFLLLDSALDRPIAEVLDHLEGPDAEGRAGCVFGWPTCGDESPCPLHHRWGPIRGAFDEMLDRVKVRDLT